MRFPTLGWAFGCALGAMTMTQVAAAQQCTPPRILLVVDASSSMNGMLGNNTKWESAQAAMQTVLSTYPTNAQYGLMLFPGTGGQCTHGEVVVDVASDTGGQILQAMVAPPPSAGAHTPAGQSLMEASQYNYITDPNFTNYVIFVTDGYQYCSVNGGNSCATTADCAFMGVSACPTCLPDANDGCYCTRSWPVLGAQALAAAGVTTYVVGFGEQVDVQVLNQTANAGGTALPNCDPNSTTPSCYFQATAPAELTAALGQIMQQVLVTETCSGDCGLMGERTCTLDGWTDCNAPDAQSCVATCGKPGIQQCVNNTLTDCSSESECGQGGGGQGGSVTSSGGAGGAGGAGGNGGADDDGQDPEETGSCGCRTAGRQPTDGAPLGALAFLGLGVALLRRRQR